MWRQAIEEPFTFSPISTRQMILSLGLLGMYFVLPVIFLNGPLRQDSHYVKTLQAHNERVGKHVEFDRVLYEQHDKGETLETLTFEKIRILNNKKVLSTQVSARGRFVDPQTVEILEIHEHVWWFRDGSSYIGILLLISMWGMAWVRTNGQRGVYDS